MAIVVALLAARATLALTLVSPVAVKAKVRGPTVPLIAPPIDMFDEDEAYTRINLLMLRNPTVVNLLDGTALSVPIHGEEEPPIGLMIAGFAGEDHQVLRIGAWIEEVL